MPFSLVDLAFGADVPPVLCPRCHAESLLPVCQECGLDLEIHRELVQLRGEILELRQKVESRQGLPGDGQETMPPPLPQIKKAPVSVPERSGTTKRSASGGGAGGKSAELAVGQNWFLGIGVLILIIGIGFFLKYAFDQQWIGPAVQVTTGFVCGAVLLFLGHLCHAKKIRGLDVGVGAVGLGALYLSSYAASQVHHLLPFWLTLVLILLVTLLGAGLALSWESQTFAMLSSAGGYLAPLLFSSSLFYHWFFLGYLFILILASQVMAYLKGWKTLYAISALLTWLAIVIWTERDYQKAWFLETFVFAQLLFVASSLAPFLRTVVRQDFQPTRGFPLATVNGLLCCWYSADLLEYARIPGAFVSCAYAVLVLLLAGILRRQRIPGFVSAWLLAQGLAFLLVFAVQLFPDSADSWVTVFWSAELLAWYWVAAKSKDRQLLFGAILIGLLVMAECFFNRIADLAYPLNGHVFSNGLGERLVAGIATVASLLGVSWLDQTARVQGTHPTLNRTFEFLGLVSLFALANDELARFTTEFLRPFGSAAHSVLWAFFSIGLLIFGLWRRRWPYRIGAIILLFVTVFKVLIFDTAQVATPYRILSCLVLGAILITVSFLYFRFNERIRR